MTRGYESIGAACKSGNPSIPKATKEPTNLKLGLFEGLMEPVSDEEWEKMDEEFRARFVDEDQF